MDEPILNKALHIKYFQRCLKSLLPTGYTSNDSSRIALAFFILAALELLGAGPDTFSQDERDRVKKWFLSCQCRSGGFAGNPGLKFDHVSGDTSDEDEKNERQPWLDGASVPMTYFALMGLSMVDGLDEVNRGQCLKWLRGLQRGDGEEASGGFGEAIGLREGDMRVGFSAAVIRWVLGGGDEGWTDEAEDIDVERFVGYFRAGETYDGGISESALHESHGGYVTCAITSLALLNRLPIPPTFKTTAAGKPPGLTNVDSTIRWLMERQQAYIAVDEEYEDSDDDEDDKNEPAKEFRNGSHPSIFPSNASPKPGTNPEKKLAMEIPTLLPQTLDECYYVGQNGRCNKPVDTCYSYWNCASLDVLGHGRLINRDPIRRFLLEQTQHRIGGFGKVPGDPPDIYHSYLALAALATMKEPKLKELDAALCVSLDVKKKIEAFKERRGKPAVGQTKGVNVFDLLDGMAKASLILRGKGNAVEEMEREKERLVAAARGLKA